MRIVADFVERLSGMADPVLIVGDPGVGKDLVAEYLHHQSGRSPLFKVGCDQPEELLRRQLLGYVNESLLELVYDPAEAFEPGVIERAAGGSVYLDRIDLARHNCVQLLSDVLSRSSQTTASVRFIASCAVAPFPEFRDAYVSPRLRPIFGSNVISVPSVKDRIQDLPELIDVVVREEAEQLGIQPPFIQPSVAGQLGVLEWTTNVAEMRRFFAELLVARRTGLEIDDNMITQLWQKRVTSASEPRERSRQRRCGALAAGLSYQGSPVSASHLYDWIAQFLAYRELGSSDPRDLSEQLVRMIRTRFYYDEPRLRVLIAKVIGQTLLDLNADAAWSWLNTSDNPPFSKSALPHVTYCDPLGPMKSSGRLSYILRQIGGLRPSLNAVDLQGLRRRVETERKGLVVLLVDDFLGSGNQFTDTILPSLMTDGALEALVRKKKREGIPIRMYMLTCVAFDAGVEKVEAAIPPWLDLRLKCGDLLGSEARVFSPESAAFPDQIARVEAEKLFVDRIGRRLHPSAPYGYEDVQGAVVFEHNTPNDTLPIVWKDGYVEGRRWNALFRRSAT